VQEPFELIASRTRASGYPDNPDYPKIDPKIKRDQSDLSLFGIFEGSWLAEYLTRAWEVSFAVPMLHRYGEALILRVVVRLDDMERKGQIRNVRNRRAYFAKAVQLEAGE